MRKDKIVITLTLRRYVLNCHNAYLLHPVMDRTDATIWQNFYWTGIREAVHKEVTRYDVCQHIKRSTKKYGKLPAKLAEETPWNKVCVDIMSTYKIHRKGKYTLILKDVTMIEPITRGFEVTQYHRNKAMTVANLV